MGVVLMARKSLYETQVKPYLSQIEEMAQNGISQAQIASMLKINTRTFEKYLTEEEDLRKAVYSGREVAIKEVENALYKSAIGSKELVKKGMKVKKVIYENGRKKGEVETIEPYEEEIYVKPDTQAGIFLLKNWAKDRYSSDPQMLEIKKREQELKEKQIDLNDDDDFDVFS